MSQITTHILDTSVGRPAKGVPVTLEVLKDSWEEIGKGFTNEDGRVANLLEKDIVLEKGVYRISFKTSDYFKAQDIKAFYPYVSVVFEIEGDGQHYHVPLLLNPFGYSTYRGS